MIDLEIKGTITKRLARQIEEELAAKMIDLSQHAARIMEEEYQEACDAEFIDRPPNRRNSANLRLRDSMKATVETTGGGFPIKVNFKLAPGASADKVRVLDSGGGAHSRGPSFIPINRIPTTGAKRDKNGWASGLFSQQTDAFGGDERWFTKINHPGVKRPGRFLRRAQRAGARVIRTGK